MRLINLGKFLAIAIAAGSFASNVFATTIAQWTFETSQPATAGPFTPEAGVNAALSQASTNTTAGANVGTISSPAGNGSSHSFSSNGWDVPEYFQFKTSTLGFASLGLTFDETGSNTGPRDFRVDTSTDGSSFTPGPTYSILANAAPNNVWSAATPHPEFGFSFSLPTALENQATAYVRLVNTDTVSANGGTVGSGGTNRIDNVTISGTLAVPEPASAALMVMAGLALIGFGRRAVA
jgi:hypothetical protein